jgi:hypothetical protein
MHQNTRQPTTGGLVLEQAVLRDFGPIRNLWEGGGQGEKIIGLLKPSWFGFRKKKALQLVE